MSHEEQRPSKRAKPSDAEDVISPDTLELCDHAAESEGDTGAGTAAEDHGDQTPHQTYDDEFGTEMAYLLESEVLPEAPSAWAEELWEVAKHNPAGIRAWIGEKLGTIECGCVDPLPKWKKSSPNEVSTCGRQQAHLLSQLDMDVSVYVCECLSTCRQQQWALG